MNKAMRIICNSCGKTFSMQEQPQFCPFCASAKIELTGRASALKMLENYNELDRQMNELIEKYTPIYLEAERIRSTLRTYKSRGILTEAEMPVKKRPQILATLSDYRKKRK